MRGRSGDDVEERRRLRASSTTMRSIPDLWRIKEDAQRLYQLYLGRLMMSGAHERVVEASRRIRRHAARGPGREAGVFTFWFEVDALCDLKQYQTAWRQLRRWEEIALGRRIDLRRQTWPADELAWFEYEHIPLLYFMGRYREGCRLLEAILDSRLDEPRARSYDVLFRIYNGDKEPADRCRVTLTHFYSRLGKDLLRWPRWEEFVNGLDSRLFRLAAIRREELLADPRRLTPFYKRLMAIRDERMTSGTTSGERDLTDSAAKVRKRQDGVQETRRQFNESYKARRKVLNAKLRDIFPE